MQRVSNAVGKQLIPEMSALGTAAALNVTLTVTLSSHLEHLAAAENKKGFLPSMCVCVCHTAEPPHVPTVMGMGPRNPEQSCAQQVILRCWTDLQITSRSSL